MAEVALAQLLQGVIGGRLEPLLPAPGPEWHLWERRTANLHRGAVLWHPERGPSTLDELSDAVRGVISERYAIRGFRGLGFGAVVALDRLPWEVSHVADLIDARANRRGTWQWIVLVSGESASAVAAHTWKEGYLTPVCRALIAELERHGYDVTTAVRPQDALQQTLDWIATRLSPGWWLGRGLRGLRRRSDRSPS